VSITTDPITTATSTDPLSLLTPTERRWYRVADTLARRWPWLSILWNQLFMVNVVRLLAMRRITVTGLEHLEKYGPDARLVLVSNHRSFFDFFVIGAILYTRTRLPKKVFFPVRATFFYEGWLGAAVNAVMSGFTMFPPILRDQQRNEFNRFALGRIAEALAEPGQWIGLHPEGKRNPNPDPYELLRPQPGIGKIALQNPDVELIPVWIHGLTNSIGTEARRNWTAPSEHPIDLCFGAPVDISDIRGNGQTAALTVANRCMDAIRALAAAQRARRSS
jgi:1-acyl-sn-glycerol-3-phosphate acyltransferase